MLNKKAKACLFIVIVMIFITTFGLINVSADELGSKKVTVLDAWKNFDVWKGSGTASVTLDNDIFDGSMKGMISKDKFVKINFNEKELDNKNYELSEVNGKVVITLKEDYLKTLKDGEYFFSGEFTEASVPLKLYVATHQFEVTDKYFSFNTWTGSGNATVDLNQKIDDYSFNNVLFEKLLYKGNEIDKSNYLVKLWPNGTRIELTENYLRTLSAGEHYFEAEFANVKVKLKLNIKANEDSKATSESSTTDAKKDTITSVKDKTNNPKTGDSTAMAVSVVLIMSLSVVTCLGLKKIIINNKNYDVSK